MARAPADWRSVLRRAEVLVRRRDMRCLDLLLPALRWRSQGARNRAVVLLARMGPVAVPPLVVALEGARTATERWGAADALGRIGDSRAVSRLIHALEDPAMTVRRASMVALQRLEAMNAVPRIARLLGDESGGVRVTAAAVLGKFEDPRAVPALVRSLGDAQWDVRQASGARWGRSATGGPSPRSRKRLATPASPSPGPRPQRCAPCDRNPLERLEKVLSETRG